MITNRWMSAANEPSLSRASAENAVSRHRERQAGEHRRRDGGDQTPAARVWERATSPPTTAATAINAAEWPARALADDDVARRRAASPPSRGTRAST